MTKTILGFLLPPGKDCAFDVEAAATLAEEMDLPGNVFPRRWLKDYRHDQTRPKFSDMARRFKAYMRGGGPGPATPKCYASGLEGTYFGPAGAPPALRGTTFMFPGKYQHSALRLAKFMEAVGWELYLFDAASRMPPADAQAVDAVEDTETVEATPVSIAAPVDPIPDTPAVPVQAPIPAVAAATQAAPQDAASKPLVARGVKRQRKPVRLNTGSDAAFLAPPAPPPMPPPLAVAAPVLPEAPMPPLVAAALTDPGCVLVPPTPMAPAPSPGDMFSRGFFDFTTE